MAHESSGKSTTELTRRVMLRGAAVGGVALPLLAACGSDSEPTGQPTVEATDEPTDQPTDGPTDGGAGGDALASTGDVPVGEGTILAEEQIVLTQPTEGDFKAFTAVCTHQQCIVSEVSDGIIECACHGSEYSIEDGSVVGGPAPSPLAAIDITVDGDQIMKG